MMFSRGTPSASSTTAAAKPVRSLPAVQWKRSGGAPSAISWRRIAPQAGAYLSG